MVMEPMQGKLASSQFDFGYTQQFCIPGTHNLSPMAAISKYIKDTTENAKTIFIGPCTAKKAEAQLDSVKPYVDSVLTFEELQALFDSRDIDITALEEDVLDNASYFGRIFARSGGLPMLLHRVLRNRI